MGSDSIILLQRQRRQGVHPPAWADLIAVQAFGKCAGKSRECACPRGALLVHADRSSAPACLQLVRGGPV